MRRATRAVIERRLEGRPAAPGMARGPVVVLAQVRSQRRAAGDPVREKDDLRDALLAAVVELRAMAAGADTDAAAMLEFQVAMLEDDELAAPAFGSRYNC